MINAIWMIFFFLLLLPYFVKLEWGTKPVMMKRNGAKRETETPSVSSSPSVSSVTSGQQPTRAALHAGIKVAGVVTPQERTMLKALAALNPTITPDPTTGGAWASWDRGKRNVQLTPAQAGEYRRLTNAARV